MENPIFDRRHYAAVAEILRQYAKPRDPQTASEIIAEFAHAFAADNPRFNWRKFVSACG